MVHLFWHCFHGIREAAALRQLVGEDERAGIENLRLDVPCPSLNREHGSVHFHSLVMVLNNQFRSYFATF